MILRHPTKTGCIQPVHFHVFFNDNADEVCIQIVSVFPTKKEKKEE